MRRPALTLIWLLAGACSLPRTGAGQAPDAGVAAGFACLVEPAMVIDVSTAVEGVLERVEVEKGDRVAEGDVIARLASDVEKTAVDQARARVAARASLRAREVALRYARAKYDRAEGLRQQRFVSGDELDDLRSEVELAELALAEERERKGLAELELLRAEALYRTRVVRSPVEGIVVERLLGPGEFARAQPIARLARVDPLHVEVTLPVAMFGRIRADSRAEVRLAPPVGGTYSARVSRVDRLIDGASATFAVRLELPNPRWALPAGIDCNARFLELAAPNGPGLSSGGAAAAPERRDPPSRAGATTP